MPTWFFGFRGEGGRLQEFAGRLAISIRARGGFKLAAHNAKIAADRALGDAFAAMRLAKVEA